MTPPMCDFAWRQAALPLAARRSPICAVSRLTSARSASISSWISLAPATAALLVSLTASLAAFDMLDVFDMSSTPMSVPRRGADRGRALADHATGDALAGIARWIAPVVVLAAVDHNAHNCLREANVVPSILIGAARPSSLPLALVVMR